jgi:hypothetical protein
LDLDVPTAIGAFGCRTSDCAGIEQPAGLLHSGSMSALRSAVRHIASAPWLTAVIVASMALGTGANAAVYSAVDALLFRAPPGVVGATRLVDLYTSQLNGGTFGNSSYPDFLSIAATPSLEAAAAVEEGDVETVRVGDANVTARTAAVSSGFWRCSACWARRQGPPP